MTHFFPMIFIPLVFAKREKITSLIIIILLLAKRTVEITMERREREKKHTAQNAKLKYIAVLTFNILLAVLLVERYYSNENEEEEDGKDDEIPKQQQMK